jgi:hypothetical protein
MTTKKLLATVFAGILATSAGCVTHQHTDFVNSLRSCGPADIPAPVRQRVYLFLMNGADVIDSAGLSRLRNTVCEAGFSKVYLAQRMDANWYEREVRRVAYEDPSARVILLGVGVAADTTLALAQGVVSDGVNVDAVMLLDPVGTCQVPDGVSYRTVVIRSHQWKVSTGVIAAENIVVEKTGHLSVANCPAVVETVVKQMVASANKVGALPPEPLPQTPLHDYPTPTPRGIDPNTLVRTADEWDFLNTGPLLVPLVIPSTNPQPAVNPLPAETRDRPGDELPAPRPAASNSETAPSK